MNEAVRRARLRGAREAERLLSILEVRERYVTTYERVDVFDALAWLDVRVMFRPLHGLLGAYIRGNQPGVMISTRRPLSVQRFTAAHELGHAVLGHEPSLDSPNVLRRAALGQSAPKIAGFASYLQEIEADAFAGSFLLPIWLITHHARKQGWSKPLLANEDVVYQLSLRCGSSFQATVWALERHKIISDADRARLLGVEPKALKARLGHAPPIAETRRDAWLLRKGDGKSAIPVERGDTVAVALEQHAGGGYLWKPVEDPPNQLTAIADEVLVDTESVGAHSSRKYLYKAELAGPAQLCFEHKRPWESDANASEHFNISIFEPEQGLSRANRARMVREKQEPSGLNAI